MKKIDYHIHTHFSADSQEYVKNHIEKAIELGLEEICFCDHQDFSYPGTSFDLDVDAYYKEIQMYQNIYKDQLIIKWGIEIGLDCNYQKEINTLIHSYPFDFVIGSIHVIDNQEFYDPAIFFHGKSKNDAHRDFFKETLKAVQTFDCFHVLGHLDYIVRYGPYEDKEIEYDVHQEIIDNILKTLIHKGIGLELNLSGYKVHQTCGFPNYKILQRYYDLGGRILTTGSDSHICDTLGYCLDDAHQQLQNIGFTISTFTNKTIDK
ncbi:histidinol-phosphatase HisJ family protein [Tannockella kyphosi]|uniref:histidinol-phosphatase HisJ family protein n=1 Tax=Tannockella kyphosi TaxID=2899121 RepID=UPI0020119055|nr:histidinol-phosphatase HisJ family protein [Tannockella kyphosi]